MTYHDTLWEIKRDPRSKKNDDVHAYLFCC
jgi:hypothetical protein